MFYVNKIDIYISIKLTYINLIDIIHSYRNEAVILFDFVYGVLAITASFCFRRVNIWICLKL